MHGKNPLSVWFRRRRHDIALSMLESLEPEKVLDVGCGEGHFLTLLAKQFPKAELFGCDRSDKTVSKARELCPKAKIYSGDFMELELEPANLVVALEVMEHNENPHEMLAKSAVLVKKGGHVLISIPRPELLRWRVIWWLWTHTAGRGGLGEHTELTETELTKMAKEAGMSLKKRSRFFFGCVSTMLFEII